MAKKSEGSYLLMAKKSEGSYLLMAKKNEGSYLFFCVTNGEQCFRINFKVLDFIRSSHIKYIFKIIRAATIFKLFIKL